MFIWFDVSVVIGSLSHSIKKPRDFSKAAWRSSSSLVEAFKKDLPPANAANDLHATFPLPGNACTCCEVERHE
jgi:hypothetical protein